MGRDVQKMRQMQQELEIKQAHEERMREKAAEAAAREKVRQQIAQDKLERKQKELAMQVGIMQIISNFYFILQLKISFILSNSNKCNNHRVKSNPDIIQRLVT